MYEIMEANSLNQESAQVIYEELVERISRLRNLNLKLKDGSGTGFDEINFG